MAKKTTTVFYCQECGHESSKWMGQCPACKQWNTFVEEKVNVANSKITPFREAGKPVKISSVSMREEERVHTGIAELDPASASPHFCCRCAGCLPMRAGRFCIYRGRSP